MKDRPKGGYLGSDGIDRLNTAPLETLLRAPGVSASRARWLVERRKWSPPFRSWLEVASIGNIGKKTLRGLQGAVGAPTTSVRPPAQRLVRDLPLFLAFALGVAAGRQEPAPHP